MIIIQDPAMNVMILVRKNGGKGCVAGPAARTGEKGRL